MKARWLVLILLMAALALGYVWPYYPPTVNPASHVDWQQLTPSQRAAIEADTSLLARFWPMNTAQEEAIDKAQTKQTDWRLVAVIRQGQTHQALVLNPKGKLLTLSKGDALDEQRMVSAVLANELHWQIKSQPAQTEPAHSQQVQQVQQGVLALFAKPDTHSEPQKKSAIKTPISTSVTHE